MGRTGDVRRVRCVCMLIKYVQRAEGTQRHNGWATGWKTEESGFDKRQEQTLVFLQDPKIVSGGLTQPPIQWVPRAHSPGVKRLP
jgi:hypothetical protein